MSRNLRDNMPGAVFHTMARTQNKEHWFEPRLARAITGIIGDCISMSDARLLAFVLMTNHLHLVLVQGRMSLSAVMQPMLRRIALLIKRSKGIDGHVFSRRFRSYLCPDANYVRTAILYNHRNPFDAGLCDEDCRYEWSSHAAFVGDPSSHSVPVFASAALQLFASSSHDDVAAQRRNYLAELHAQVQLSKLRRGVTVDAPIFRGTFPSGDQFFAATMSTLPQAPPFRLPDLRDAAATYLKFLKPDVEIDQLRGSWISRPLGPLRRSVIEALLLRGYRVSRIARFLGVSDVTVSKVSCALRQAQISRGQV